MKPGKNKKKIINETDNNKKKSKDSIKNKVYEERRQKRKERDKKRYEMIKNDPEKLARLKEKRKLTYIRNKKSGNRKNVAEMSFLERKKAQKLWRDYASVHRNKIKALKAQSDHTDENGDSNSIAQKNKRSDDTAEGASSADRNSRNDMPKTQRMQHKPGHKSSSITRNEQLDEDSDSDDLSTQFKSVINYNQGPDHASSSANSKSRDDEPKTQINKPDDESSILKKDQLAQVCDSDATSTESISIIQEELEPCHTSSPAHPNTRNDEPETQQIKHVLALFCPESSTDLEEHPTEYRDIKSIEQDKQSAGQTSSVLPKTRDDRQRLGNHSLQVPDGKSKNLLNLRSRRLQSDGVNSTSDISESNSSVCSSPNTSDTDMITFSGRMMMAAKQRSTRSRKSRNLLISLQNAQINQLKRSLNNYKQKYYRLKKPKSLSPKSKMAKLAENPMTRDKVVKKAMLGEMLEKQVTNNYPKSRDARKVVNKVLLTPVSEKEKIWKYSRCVTYKKMWSQKKPKIRTKKNKLSQNVQEFLEEDENSKLCPGKNDIIGKKGQKHQKRYLQDCLKNLHKKYMTTTRPKMGYTSFRKYKPFWMVTPKITDRDTCQCTQHSNVQLIIQGLYNAKITKVATYQNCLEELCCNRFNENCLSRKCLQCVNNTVTYKEFDNSNKIQYQKWITCKEMIIDLKTKKPRQVLKTKKDIFEIYPRDLVENLENELPKFFKHELNIVHQYRVFKDLKDNMTEKDAVIHCDFSENYCTKYNEEIQSFHFGGSRMQLSLHTVVVYLKDGTQCYCTVSENLSHNTLAIWAHLRPIILLLPRSIENLHFWSDGPVTQYRNKTMFYFLANKLKELCPQLMAWSWNYHEAGHGKGAPDGVGASCKQSADWVVRTGSDVTNLKDFCKAVEERSPKIELITITDSDIASMTEYASADQANIIGFKGTLKIHQVTSVAHLPRKLTFKSLSCFCNMETCDHFRSGIMQYPADDISMDAISLPECTEIDPANETNQEESLNNVLAKGLPKQVEPLQDTTNLRHIVDEESCQDTTSGASSVTLPEVLSDVTGIENISISDIIPNLTESGEETKPSRTPRKSVTAMKKTSNKIRAPKKYMAANQSMKSIPANVSKQSLTSSVPTEQKPSLKRKPKVKKEKVMAPSLGKSRGKKKLIKTEKSAADVDHFCIICGIQYKEDVSGSDWIQCLTCGQWAQEICIKGNKLSFVCQNCQLDKDY